MMKCPACSHDNVDGTTFCEMCGEDLQGAAGATAVAGSTPIEGSGTEIKCPACENMNPAENVVCEICGTELRAPNDSDAAVTASGPSTLVADTSVSADTSTLNVPAPAVTTDTVSTPVPPAAPALDLADVAAPATTPFAAALGDIAATAAPPAAPSTPNPIIAPDAASTAAASSAPLSPGKVKLVVEQGMTIGKQFVLNDAEVQVGREDEDEGIYPDIDLADQDEGYVHRKHATLKFENDALMVTHLGGANKTRINNKPIPDNTPQIANLGDKIAFGKVVLRLMPV